MFSDRLLGVARQTVNLYENGLCEIPKDRLEAVKRMAEEVEELATAIVDTSARITTRQPAIAEQSRARPLAN